MAVERQDRCYEGPLGAAWTPEKTVFRLWAPTAEAISLCLYEESGRHTMPMTQDSGVWTAVLPGNRDGLYYTYAVTRGSTLETPDPYARACGVNGQHSMVINLARTDPPGWQESSPVTLASPVDAVICEVHLRDLSMDPAGCFCYRGKYLALTETEAVNSFGAPVGLRYFAQQGYTHLHLLPVLDFASIDESLPDGGYNWGYDPMHFFIPEGSYATDAADGAIRIRELKALIQAAHHEGLGIILDVVYNHTYLAAESWLNRCEPDYYYRHDGDAWANGSGCGNELATEQPMLRRMLLDSLCYLAQEYRVDGFRFDLMGLLDTETMRQAEERLHRINPALLLYGEGWTGGSSPLEECRRAMKQNARALPGIAFFSDDFRDAVRGHVFADEVCGYVNGDHSPEMLSRIRAALCGGVPHPETGDALRWTDSPAQCVNYAACHDDLTLHDKLLLTMPEADAEAIVRAERMAAVLLCLSQGIPFLAAGQEFLRSKLLPEGGFDHNSYCSPDSINALRWDDMTAHPELVAYYRGLLAIRRRFADFRLRSGEAIREHIHFSPAPEGVLLAEIGRFLLAVNPLEEAFEINASGIVLADDCHAAAEGLYCVEESALCRAGGSLLLLRKPAE